MPKHLGSCHCGGVRFQIETDHPLGPYFRCNCSLCSRKGTVMGAAPRDALTIAQGAELISTYVWNTREAQHYFCKVCGIYTHHGMRGETQTVGVNMACIENVDVFALGDVPVGNGRDEWSVVNESGGFAKSRTATGEFSVKVIPLGAESQPDDPRFGRMSINKSITSGLVATTVGQMLTAGTAVKGSAAYVAIEKVDGVLDGRKGSFALMHKGVMNRGAPSLTVSVVPDSGTDELTGIAGEFKIIMAGGKHAYEFNYTLP